MAITEFNDKHAFLSNFYDSPFLLDGITYPTVEHFFQSKKAKSDEDRDLVLSSPTPGGAKKKGRYIILRDDWEDIKDFIMQTGLRAKFTQNTDLKYKLISTYPEELIEGNYWHDNEWGSCQCYKCQGIAGKNKLGKMLMELREELMKEGD